MPSAQKVQSAQARIDDLEEAIRRVRLKLLLTKSYTVTCSKKLNIYSKFQQSRYFVVKYDRDLGGTLKRFTRN